MLGVWAVCFMHFCVKDILFQHFSNLLRGDTTDIRKLVIACSVTFALVMGIQILNYAIVSPRIQIDPIWIEQITSKCGTSKLETAF